MLDAGNNPYYKPNPRLARAIDVMFILHAEHEMNCSTAAARHLGSSGVDVYTAVAGARAGAAGSRRAAGAAVGVVVDVPPGGYCWC
jgi:citrate synthase